MISTYRIRVHVWEKDEKRFLITQMGSKDRFLKTCLLRYSALPIKKTDRFSNPICT